MIRNANWVETDIHQQEFPEQERYLFDLVANRGDIHKFITGNIPAHWHNELEIFMLMEGSVRIGSVILFTMSMQGKAVLSILAFFILLSVLSLPRACTVLLCLIHRS